MEILTDSPSRSIYVERCTEGIRMRMARKKVVEESDVPVLQLKKFDHNVD